MSETIKTFESNPPYSSAEVIAEDDVIPAVDISDTLDRKISIEQFRTKMISAETAARQSADTTLQGNIDSEAAARQGADTTLQGNIDSEAAARQSADNTLQNAIVGVYSTCATESATAEKNISASNFELTAAVKISVVFAEMNTAASPTLNVNATGAKAMYIGADPIVPTQLRAGKAYEFQYDGTNWQLLNPESLADTVSEMSLLTVTGQATLTAAISVIKTAWEASGYTKKYCSFSLGTWFDIDSIAAGSELGTLSNTSENLRCELAGFDTYNGVGDTDSGHGLLFQFKNGAFLHSMNSTSTNAGGYPASALKTLLNGDFATGLASALGTTLKTVHRLLDTYGSWEWYAETFFLPTEVEVFGHQAWSKNLGHSTGTSIQWSIFSLSPQKRCKKYNGARYHWWEASPRTDTTAYFCICGDNGGAGRNDATSGVAVPPAFYI